MSFTENILSWMAHTATNVISSLGYFGVFILMTFESMIVPIPSELVMPFAGYLASTGRFSFLLVIVASSLGSIVGSMLSYWIGQYGGEPFLEKYGKYFLINKKDLKWTHKYFGKHGDKTIFISRFIPIVRHLISIPAGVAGMNKKKFLLYTFIGATAWNSFLAYLGYFFGENWEIVHEYTEPFSYLMAVIILFGIGYFIYKHVYKK